MKSFKTVAVCVVLCSGTTIAVEPGPSKDVPELEKLSNWTGTWKAEIEEPVPRTGISEGKWILDGRYLQQTWKVDADDANPALLGTSIMTYDLQKKVYHRWQFHSNGFTSEATGTWDNKTRTMTWKTRDAMSGTTTTNKDHFANATLQNWNIATTDRDGKTVFEMKGKNTRKTE